MLSDYIAAGFAPGDFWRITLREVFARLSGAAKRIEREHQDRAWLAHTTAALVRTDKLPKFTDFIKPMKPSKPNADAMFNTALLWDAAIKRMQ